VLHGSGRPPGGECGACRRTFHHTLHAEQATPPFDEYFPEGFFEFSLVYEVTVR